MARSPTKDDGFQPPAYISSLIAAINDGAKSAQTGALAVLLVGLYLAATAFSATDEDLLLGKAMTISQIGASLPVTFAFAIAPGVFVFLHVYTLARYDMLAANVRHFVQVLKETVPRAADRENCLQLLANVEYVISAATPRKSPLRNLLWPILFFIVIAIVPVVLLVMVQINSLRYQSELIVYVQRAWLIVDLLLLAGFFYRNSLRPSDAVKIADTPRPDDEFDRVIWDLRASVPWKIVLVGTLPVVVLLANFVYMGVVPVDADADQVRYEPPKRSVPLDWTGRGRELLRGVWRHPVDITLCGELHWGCRYLRIENRTLVSRIWDEKQMLAFRSGERPSADTIGSVVDGLNLRNRSLRFAVLTGSRLYAADLSGSDLRGAALDGATLEGAKASGTEFSGAVLHKVDMRHASLRNARFEKAELNKGDFRESSFEGADFSRALADGARFTCANLSGTTGWEAASAPFAHWEGAIFTGADLLGADFTGGQFSGAILKGARLRGAILKKAVFRGADMSRAVVDRDPIGLAEESTPLALASLVGVQIFGDNSAAYVDAKREIVSSDDFEATARELLAAVNRRAPVAVADSEALRGLSRYTNETAPFLASGDFLREGESRITGVTHPEARNGYRSYLISLMDFQMRTLARMDACLAEQVARDSVSPFRELNEVAFEIGLMPKDGELGLGMICDLLAEARNENIQLKPGTIRDLKTVLRRAGRVCKATPHIQASGP